MRSLILTAAAALAICATDVSAQAGGTTTKPVDTKPTTTTAKPAPTSTLDEQKKQMSGELKNTLVSADNLLATANKMAEGAEGERKDMILKTTTGIKTVKNDLNTQLGLVNGATDKTAPAIMNKAKEVNAASKRSLEQLKAQLPSTKPTTSTPTDTKPTIPAETK